MTELERYTDAELTMIRDFLRLGSDTLIAHAARIDDQRRRRDGSRTAPV